MKTLVKFRVNETDKENADLFAVFPQFRVRKNTGERYYSVYSHVGQHSAGHIDYINESRSATESEYNDLKQELESIGYTLKICK